MYLFEKKGARIFFFEKLFRIFCFKGLGVSGLVWVFELRSRRGGVGGAVRRALRPPPQSPPSVEERPCSYSKEIKSCFRDLSSWKALGLRVS